MIYIAQFGQLSQLRPLFSLYGPRIRLVSVVTEAALVPDRPLGQDLCGGCDRCMRACPAQALKGERIVDKARCDAQHIKIGEKLQLDDWEQICGVCIRACPLGKKNEKTSQ